MNALQWLQCRAKAAQRLSNRPWCPNPHELPIRTGRYRAPRPERGPSRIDFQPGPPMTPPAKDNLWGLAPPASAPGGHRCVLLEAQRARSSPQLSPEALQYLLEDMREGIIAVGADWRIHYLNGEASALLADPSGPAVALPGMSLWQAFPSLRGLVFENELRLVRSQASGIRFELRHPHSQRRLAVRAYPSADGLTCFIAAAGARPSGGASPRRRSSDSEARPESQAGTERPAGAAAQQQRQVKDEFLATLSHELRTPLTSILGWTQVLRRGNRPPAELQRGLQTIERSARTQLQLIENLLDLNRISDRQLALMRTPLSPPAIVNAAIDALATLAEARHISISRHFAPRMGQVSGDPVRLRQVAWNLLSNALKFTPPGGAVQVSVTESHGQAEITVSDNGIGIGADFLPHVFERFCLTGGERPGGLGLGLSIVKYLVEQHGGNVHASSAGSGRGASFTVRLPLLAETAAGAAPERH